MVSTLYHEQLAPVDSPKSTGKVRRALGGHQLDEIVVFALVAVAVLYIAAASCWFIF